MPNTWLLKPKNPASCGRIFHYQPRNEPTQTMSFFNLNRGSSSSTNAPAAAQPESMDVIRKRAKHRLIGAAVLVLIGIVGFPLLFDAQPRPIAVDIPIEIPGKNTVKPLTLPSKPDAVAQAPDKPASKPVVAAKTEKAEKAEKTDKVAAAASLDSQEEIITDKKPVAPAIPALPAIKKEAEKVARAEAKTPVKPEPKPDSKPEAKAEPKPAAKSDDGARAKALLDGQGNAAAPAPAAAGSDRMIVQVGAFADADKAKEVRQKLEKAGLKTYTQVAETKDGQRTRVRVGPFASRADAEKAASKIKSLDLPASILTL
jgi:DedD protein